MKKAKKTMSNGGTKWSHGATCLCYKEVQVLRPGAYRMVCFTGGRNRGLFLIAQRSRKEVAR